jgi:hypothetical protein
MPVAKGRASERALDTLHRLTVKSLTEEMRRLHRAREPVPAGLISASTALLKATGVTAPARNPGPQRDRLAGLREEYNKDEAEESALTNFSEGTRFGDDDFPS